MSKSLKKISNKIFLEKDLKKKLDFWRQKGDKIVFTNGCFDLVHRGHVEMLANTADLGDRLIIGLNTDSSIKNLKSENRPIVDEYSRSILLASLQFTDAIVLFSENTPQKIIETINPDVLAKGGDYNLQEIVGYDVVTQNGGDVVQVPFIDGYSTSNIIHKIKQD